MGRPKGGPKFGGRKKGTPNKVTSVQREAFMLLFGKLECDIERWIKETGDGFQAVHFLADGSTVPFLEKNPGKAAELMLRMAEYHYPKKRAVEVTGEGGGPVTFEFPPIPAP